MATLSVIVARSTGAGLACVLASARAPKHAVRRLGVRGKPTGVHPILVDIDAADAHLTAAQPHWLLWRLCLARVETYTSRQGSCRDLLLTPCSCAAWTPGWCHVRQPPTSLQSPCLEVWYLLHGFCQYAPSLVRRACSLLPSMWAGGAGMERLLCILTQQHHVDIVAFQEHWLLRAHCRVQCARKACDWNECLAPASIVVGALRVARSSARSERELSCRQSTAPLTLAFGPRLHRVGLL